MKAVLHRTEPRAETGEPLVEGLCLSHQSQNQYPGYKLSQLLTLESDTGMGNCSLQLLKPQNKPPPFMCLQQGPFLVSLAAVWMLVGGHIS